MQRSGAGRVTDALVQRDQAGLVAHLRRLGNFEGMPQLVPDERNHVIGAGVAAHLNPQIPGALRARGEQQSTDDRGRQHATGFDVDDHVTPVQREHEMRERARTFQARGNHLGHRFVRSANVTVRRAHEGARLGIRHRRELTCGIGCPRKDQNQRTRENA